MHGVLTWISCPPALIRYRTSNLRSTNRQPKKPGSTMTGYFLVCSTPRGRAKCKSMMGNIRRSSNARCLILAVRVFKRRGWPLIGAKCMGFKGAFEWKTQTAGSKEQNHNHPASDRQTQKKKEKKLAKTEYLMVNLAG